jgi:pilus assembly protein Flp/PilA
LLALDFFIKDAPKHDHDSRFSIQDVVEVMSLGAGDVFNGCPGCNLLGAKNMKNLIVRFGNDESGATAIEYGLLAALIAVVMIAAVTAVGTQLSKTFSNIASNINK